MRLAEARPGPEARSLEDAPLGQRAELRSHLHSERQLEMAQLGKRMDLATIGLQSSAEPTHRDASPRAHGEEGEPKAHEPEVGMVGEAAQLGKRPALAAIGLQRLAHRAHASPKPRHRKQNSATR